MQTVSIPAPQGGSLAVSKIILGSVAFGSSMPKEQSFEIMDLYYEKGGRTIDTARVYSDWLPGGHGASERTVGEWIRARGCRERITLITKGAHPPFGRFHESRLTPEDIRSDFTESLQALQTGYVDIYFLHRDDEAVPVSVVMDTLDELVKSGRVRMLGASNWRAGRIREANAYAAAASKTPFSVSEIQWSYAFCTPEILGDDTLVCMDEQQLALYQAMQMPVFAFSSQAMGLFSKGYREDLSDLSEKHRAFYCEENIRRYRTLLQTCREQGITPAKAALLHITQSHHPEGFAIIGCSGKEQLLESIEAGE